MVLIFTSFLFHLWFRGISVTHFALTVHIFTFLFKIQLLFYVCCYFEK